MHSQVLGMLGCASQRKNSASQRGRGLGMQPGCRGKTSEKKDSVLHCSVIFPKVHPKRIPNFIDWIVIIGSCSFL